MRSFFFTRFAGSRSVIASCAALISCAALAPCVAAAAPAPPTYTAGAPQSHLTFTGIQAGAPFTAEFHKFTATVTFAPGALAQSRLDVLIDLNSVDSKDRDRDGTMRGGDLFAVAQWPTAHYVARSFSATAGGFRAMGSLTLRGVTRNVSIAFKFTRTPAGATLAGDATVKRLDFGVGQGDWKSTEWVGNDVKIAFSLVLTPKR